jgi:hypothetical protein
MEVIIDMDTLSDPGALYRTAYFVARVSIFLFGLGAIAWGAYQYPSMPQRERVERTASDLLKGREFSSRTLTNLLSNSDSAAARAICVPGVLRSLVVLHIALLKSEIADGKASAASADASYVQLYQLAKAALGCSPSDPYIWMILFWLDASRHGLTPENAKFLQMSYESGSNEGWIAFERAQIALPLLYRLPAQLSQNVIDDFIKLLNTRILYNDLAAILASEPRGVQSRVIESLNATDLAVRRSIASALRDKGFDVVIPGVQAPDRPWH